MKLSSSLIVILGAVALVSCEVFFEEKFLDGELNSLSRRWLSLLLPNWLPSTMFRRVGWRSHFSLSSSALRFTLIATSSRWHWRVICADLGWISCQNCTIKIDHLRHSFYLSFFRQIHGKRNGCLRSTRAKSSANSWEQLESSSMMRKRMLVRWLSIHICAEIVEFRPDKVTTFMQHFYLRVILYTHTLFCLSFWVCVSEPSVLRLYDIDDDKKKEREEKIFCPCCVLSVNQF